MFQPIQTLELPGFAVCKLMDSGFFYCEDLWYNAASTRDADELLRTWGSNVCEKLKQQATALITNSALDIWQEECTLGSIVTFCKELDDCLGGGVPLQSITELCGAPGSGKTQMCLQLCVDVQIPRCCGGVEGTAVYIDTKSGFTPVRLADMAAAWVKHCQTVYARTVGVEVVLQGVNYVAAHDFTQLMAALHLVYHRLQQSDCNVKLLVVDSLTFPFQHSTANSLAKTRLLSIVMDKLHIMTSAHKIAVVVTNQLSTRVGPDPESRLVPAQGESFAHRVNQRLLLGRMPAGHHTAVLLKSAAEPCESAAFQILLAGIRDYLPTG